MRTSRDSDRQSKRESRDSMGRRRVALVDGCVHIAIDTPTVARRAAEWPIIDGLEPVLGRDPSTSLEFTPHDDRVGWLRIHRQPHRPCVIVFTAGPLTNPVTAREIE